MSNQHSIIGTGTMHVHDLFTITPGWNSAGTNCSVSSIINYFSAGVAQLVEQRTRNA